MSADPTVSLSDVTVPRSPGGLQGISLTAAPGEWLVLFGPAGAGKSTLLQVLTGEVAPSTGQALVVGGAPRDAGHSVSAVGQMPPRTTRRSVRAHVHASLAAAGAARASRPALVADALIAADLYDVREERVAHLSCRQQTALRIAAALATEPRVLLLDDVMGPLDPFITQSLRSSIDRRRQEQGLTVVEAVCDPRAAERSGRVALLHDGRLVACDAPGALLALHAPPSVTIEAADPASVIRTLRGIYDLVITETEDGVRIEGADSVAATATVLRHPTGGVRAAIHRRGDLWQVWQRLSGA